jgi:hypothetical protein
MRELQGPRIPREEGSRRRRPIGWIAAGLIALLLLALLIPFACQALTGNLTLREALPARRRNTGAQAADDGERGAGGRGGAGLTLKSPATFVVD